MRQWMFGAYADPNSSKEVRQALLNKYNSHNDDIREYFGNRSDFLKIDVAKNTDWSALCGFLDKPVPIFSFPHKNKSC